MADADGDGIDEDSFLTGVTELDSVGFSAASGVDVRRLAEAIIGTVVFTVAVGVNTVVSGIASAYAGLIDGVQGFLVGSTTTEWFLGEPVELEQTGLIEVIFETGTAAIRGAWSFSLDSFGVFAPPVAIAIMLVTFLVIQTGIEQLEERT